MRGLWGYGVPGPCGVPRPGGGGQGGGCGVAHVCRTMRFGVGDAVGCPGAWGEALLVGKGWSLWDVALWGA